MRKSIGPSTASIPLLFILLHSFLPLLLLQQKHPITAQAKSIRSNTSLAIGIRSTHTCSAATTTHTPSTSTTHNNKCLTKQLPIAFILKMNNNNNTNSSNNKNKQTKKEIYNIPGSGWTSPTWNWGYANGTGHDCALICRRKYSTEQSRQELIQSLLFDGEDNNKIANDDTDDNDNNTTPSFEEVKLILGLTIQRGRWDGTDGGRNGGYGQVLEYMAQAERYESSNEELNSKLFVKDMSDRFHLIVGNMFNDDDENDIDIDDSMKMMKQIQNDYEHDYDIMRRKCTGLVLKKMGFVEFGM